MKYVIMRRRRSNGKPAGFIRTDSDNRRVACFTEASAEYVVKVNRNCGLFNYEIIQVGEGQ